MTTESGFNLDWQRWWLPLPVRVDILHGRAMTIFYLDGIGKESTSGMGTAGTIASVVVGLLFGVGGSLMGLPQTFAHYVACAAFLIAEVWAGVFGFLWIQSRSVWKAIDMVKAACLAGFIMILTPLMIWFSWPGALAQPLPQAPPISGNCNAIGNGNSNCSPTYNLAPQRLRLNDNLRAEILKRIPLNKPGHIEIIGATQADQNVGMEIFGFMKQNGYSLGEPLTEGQVIPAPSTPLTFAEDSTSWTLTISPSAR
jgi:hypothetical protein